MLAGAISVKLQGNNVVALKRGSLLVRQGGAPIEQLDVVASGTEGAREARWLLFRATPSAELDARTDPLVNARALIPELCRQFYQLGWVTGTGGGFVLLCIVCLSRPLATPPLASAFAQASSTSSRRRPCRRSAFRPRTSSLSTSTGTFSYVFETRQNQKHRPLTTIVVPTPKSRPTNPNYRPSACTPLFFNAYDLRDAGACIHTHSMSAMLVTLVCVFDVDGARPVARLNALSSAV